jgi:long-chain acyl-CoA synthetase
MQTKSPIHDQDLILPIEHFYHWEQQTPEAVFLRQPFGTKWLEISYSEAGQIIRKLVSALQKMGLQPGDQVGILSKNCAHWVLADLAIIMGKYVSVPYYASLPKASLKEVLELSKLKALFVGKLDSWGDKAEVIPEGVKVIKFPPYPGNATITPGYEWNEILSSHLPMAGQPLPKLDDLWTILFTSGTTGRPKGAMHTFRNPAIIFRIEELTTFTGTLQLKKKKWFSFLPLNHVAERIGVEMNCVASGGTISFAESIDTFAANLKNVQPSFLFAVPRIWIKFYQAVQEKIPTGILRLLMHFKLGRKILRRAMGLDDLEIAATGAAITPAHIKQWYKKLGIHLVEAYGMTEVCGSISNGPHADTPHDSVGMTVPYCETRIDPENGEILMKAPYQMIGYYNDPEKTAQVLRNGWIHSGDRGTIDEKGYIRVIGRLGDAFKTSKGQFIIPNPLEEKLSMNDFIEQVCVLGFNCNQPLALINLSPLGQAQNREAVQRSLLDSLAQLNQQRPKYQQLSTLVIDQTTWSEANRMLTPTLKVRRAALNQKYQHILPEWEKSEELIIWI